MSFKPVFSNLINLICYIFFLVISTQHITNHKFFTHLISSHFISSLFLCTEEPDVRTRKIVKVVTQTMVNGKVVDESSEVEQIEETKK